MDRREFLTYFGLGAAVTAGYVLNNLPNFIAPVKIGEPAPDFKLPDLNGRIHQLSHYRGMPVVLNFWETWCGPCRTEMPTINDFTRAYNGKAAVLTITTDEQKNTKEYLSEHNLNSIVALIDGGTTFGAYSMWGIPTTFIVDREGKFVKTLSGQTDFTDPEGKVRKTIDDLLAK